MKFVSLFILATWISGCASVLTIRGESLKSNTDSQINKYICPDYAIQVVWRNYAIGQVFESNSEKKI